MFETQVFYQLNEKHRKYYLIEKYVKDGYATITGIWGRLDAPGQKQIKYNGYDGWAGERVVNEIVETREKHGYTFYKKVNSPAPKTLTLTEAMLAEL